MSGSGYGSGGGSGSGSGYNDAVYTLSSSYSLNGSSAPNNSELPLSTPVNTSSGNGGSSGTNLASVLSGLGQIGTSAANAYQVLTGRAPSPGVSGGPVSGSMVIVKKSKTSKYLLWVLIGGFALIVLALVMRKK